MASVGALYDPRQERPRPAYVFVATLCYSRHQYAELVFDQKMPTWIGLHRRAFEFWGGVPRRIVPDNLKAAVSQALVYDPVLGEAYRRMAQHYGFLISPTRPATPQHKGKVENGVHYVQRNFMAGQQFTDIDMANRRLKTWVRERAGTRDHGTTHQAPLKLFATHEQAALLPLPAEPFTLLAIRPVKVHPDCHVVIEGSYYSVPYRYVGQTLDAYIGERVVQLFSGQELVCTHERALQPGEHHTRLEHYPAEKAAYLQRTPARCRQLAAEIGPATLQVVQTLLDDRPLDRLRSVQAILRLEERVGRPAPGGRLRPCPLLRRCPLPAHQGDPQRRPGSRAAAGRASWPCARIAGRSPLRLRPQQRRVLCPPGRREEVGTMMTHPLLPKLRQLKLSGMLRPSMCALPRPRARPHARRVPGPAAGRRTGAAQPESPGAAPGPVGLR